MTAADFDRHIDDGCTDNGSTDDGWNSQDLAFEEPLVGLDELLIEVVDCCRDLASVRLDQVGERQLLVALSELMSIEVMLESVQRRLTELPDEPSGM